jgi:hypothetical protein
VAGTGATSLRRYRQGFDQTRLWGRPEKCRPRSRPTKRFAVLICRRPIGAQSKGRHGRKVAAHQKRHGVEDLRATPVGMDLRDFKQHLEIYRAAVRDHAEQTVIDDAWSKTRGRTWRPRPFPSRGHHRPGRLRRWKQLTRLGTPALRRMRPTTSIRSIRQRTIGWRPWTSSIKRSGFPASWIDCAHMPRSGRAMCTRSPM